MSAYSDFMTLSAARYSCRNYATRTVARETLKKAIEAASLAPSAVNRQPWTFVVLDTPEMRQAIAECYPHEWIKTAPAFIVAVGNHSEAWHRPSDGKDHTDIDLAIAIEHLCLAATSLGLGTCWVCNFDAKKCAELLHLPESAEPVAILPIGYPAESLIPEKKRKPVDEIIQWGAY